MQVLRTVPTLGATKVLEENYIMELGKGATGLHHIKGGTWAVPAILLLEEEEKKSNARKQPCKFRVAEQNIT
jgi:hypothetical protein